MKTSMKRAMHLRSRGVLAAAMCGAALSFASAAQAGPVTYRGTVVTNIRLGTQSYQNAALSMTFVGDTTDVAPATDANGNNIPSYFCPGMVVFYWIAKGRASFSFESGGKRVSGHFLPGQIFVALDTCNGGIGFGSYTGPHGVEPAYPLAYTHGSAENFSFSKNPLSTAVNTSGNAWSCIGFPPDFNSTGNGGPCTSPDAYPLHTDLGQDLFVYMPYRFLCGYDDVSICADYSGSMNRGTFSVMLGSPESD